MSETYTSSTRGISELVSRVPDTSLEVHRSTQYITNETTQTKEMCNFINILMLLCSYCGCLTNKLHA